MKDALRQLFTDGTDGDLKGEPVRLSIRQIIEQALKAATRDLLGRDHSRAGATIGRPRAMAIAGQGRQRGR